MARLDMDTTQLQQELQRLLQDVISSLLGDAVDGHDDSPRAQHRLACRVAIHGEFEGHVAVRATLGVASLFALKMFGTDLLGAPRVQDAQEALREVANIVAGNLKPLFGERNTLGLPEDLPDDVQLSKRGQLVEATTQHVSGTIEVSVYAAL